MIKTGNDKKGGGFKKNTDPKFHAEGAKIPQRAHKYDNKLFLRTKISLRSLPFSSRVLREIK